MKRIVLSLVVVAVLAAGSLHLLTRARCAALPESVAHDAGVDFIAPLDEPAQAPVVAQAYADEAAPELAPGRFVNTSEPSPQSAAADRRIIKVPVTRTVYEDRVVEVEQGTPLQQQYSLLMLKRAQRMTEEELKQAISEVEAELNEQDSAADAELQKAVEILEKLKQNSGGTPAARRAEQALPLLSEPRTPVREKAVIDQTSLFSPSTIPNGTTFPTQ